MKPTFATKVTDSVCKWVSGSIVLLMSALTQEACSFTQKLDLDQMSERSICILTDTYIYIYDYSHFLLQILGLFISYIYKENGCKKKT